MRLPARSRILCAAFSEGQLESATRLALPAHSRLLKLERLRQSGETPFAAEICYLPAEDFAGLLSLPLERRSLFATLEREHGIELQSADEEVDATPASARIAELLGIHAGARAAHASRFVLHRWQSHRVRDRFLPLRSPHAFDPPLPKVVRPSAVTPETIPACPA